MMFHKWPDGKGGKKEASTRESSIFPHRDLACLGELDELKKIQMEDIYLTNKIFRSLSKRYVLELKKCKMWGPLTQTCRQLTQENVNDILNVSDTWIGGTFYENSQKTIFSFLMAPTLKSEPFMVLNRCMASINGSNS